MSWLAEYVRPKIRTLLGRREVPDNLWVQCPECQQMLFASDLARNLKVCTACGFHMRPTAAERSVLGAFRYASNVAYLHGDASLMPRRKAAWAAWNYLAEGRGAKSLAVSYWMNALQRLPTRRNVFVTLNPTRPPRGVLRVESYDHPIFDAGAIRAQKDLWSLQGAGGVWFCGAHFGSGFHEDGLADVVERIRRDQVGPDGPVQVDAGVADSAALREVS